MQSLSWYVIAVRFLLSNHLHTLAVSFVQWLVLKTITTSCKREAILMRFQLKC